jgi:hypothetical protein
MYYESKRKRRQGKDGYQLVEVVLRFNSLRLLSLRFCLHNRICQHYHPEVFLPSATMSEALLALLVLSFALYSGGV